MNNKEKNKKSIQDKLSNLKYNANSEAHLKVDIKKCLKCTSKPCTFICPAGVYEYRDDINEILVQYENCLECGACKVVCPYNSIDWQYPKSGCGIILKNS